MNKEILKELGQKAGEKYIYSKHSLDKIISEIAKDYKLNDEQIKRVCSSANHYVYATLFTNDKLSSFDLASKDGVKKYLINRLNAVEHIPCKIKKTANKEPYVPFYSGEAAYQSKIAKEINEYGLVMSAKLATDNQIMSDEINISKKRDSIQNILLGLLKSGENIDDIWRYVSIIFKDDSNTIELFEEILKDLKKKGYISKMPDEDISEDEIYVDTDTDLYKELASISRMKKKLNLLKNDSMNMSKYISKKKKNFNDNNIKINDNPFIPGRKIEA